MKRIYLLLLPVVLLVAACQSENTLFTLLDPDDTGVQFNNFIDEDAENNVLEYGYFYNGGGVAAADFNNDGLVDLYFTGNMVANQFYLNRGNMKFEEVGAQAGVNLNEGWKTGVSVVDINDDGWMDLYVCRSGAQDPALRRNLLYVNNGPTVDGIPAFTEKAAEYALDDPSYTTQAVFFDYDKDGDTDCFLLNHSVQDYAGFSQLLASYRNQRNPAYGNKLFKNEGGRFVNITDSSGIVSNVLSFGLGVNVNDFNNDGWPDIYVANDYNENDYLYLNQKNGTFREVIRQATGHVSLYSMGTDAADLNNDGWSDIITLDMLPATNERIKLTAGDDNYDKYQQLIRAGFHDQTMRNMLQLNSGINKDSIPVFSEIGQLAGISNTDWSWAALLADFDNDGYKDLFVTNGYARDYTNMEFLKYSMEVQQESGASGKAPEQMEVIAQMPAIDQPNFIFKNEGNLTFTNKVKDWGFERNSQSNGAVYADLDNDGDLDIVTSNVNEKAFIYQNNSNLSTARHHLSIRLRAPRFALLAGARLTLYESGGAIQMQDWMPVRGFQSAMAGPLHFGLSSTSVDSIKILWTDGSEEVLRKPALDRLLEMDYHTSDKVALAPLTQPLFYDAAGIDFIHHEDPRNDFRIQPLLPAMLSYQGPVVAHTLLDSGDELVYIGGARGQSGELMIKKGQSYRRVPGNTFQNDARFEDSDAVFFDADGDEDPDLLVTSAGYELNPSDSLLRPRLYLNRNGRWEKGAFPGAAVNASSVAIGDVDQDGDPDVFLGERVSPGRFPESRGGYLYLNNGKGSFSDHTSQLLPDHRNMGMITKAALLDLNQDRKPELILTTDWGPVQVWEMDAGGTYRNASDRWGTANLTGCWNTLSAADLDGDGDTDFVVGNTGTNWQWNRTAPQGLGLYASEVPEVTPIPLVSMLSEAGEYPYASRDELAGQLPEIKKKYPNYTAYARASLADLFPDAQRKAMKSLKVVEYRTGILENTKNGLRFKALPVEAQFSPVYACAVADFNGDGKPDILLGGNQSKVRVRLGKNDASLVQVFVNEGNSEFSYLPQRQSGLYIIGDVRSLSVLNQQEPVQILVGRNDLPVKTLQLAKKEVGKTGKK